MKKFFMLALIAVSMLIVSCGKNSDDTQPENVRLVGTWKCVKIERVEDGKRIDPRDVKDDGCTKYVFTDKVYTIFFINDEEGGVSTGPVMSCVKKAYLSPAAACAPSGNDMTWRTSVSG